MSEVGLTDLSKLLHTKRGQNNAIVTSRKRKLRELFAVATHADGQSYDVIANTDAPATTQAEGNFLQANEIFQGKKLSIKTIPAHSSVPFDSLQRSFTTLSQGTAAAPLPPSTDKQKRTVSPPNAQNGQPPKVSQAARSNASTPAPSTASPAGSQVDTTSIATSKASPAPSSRPSSTKPIAPALAPPANKAQSIANGSVSPAAQSPKLAAAPATTDGADQAKDDANATQRRPTQVSFPPGTKGSPVPGATNATEVGTKSQDSDATASASKSDTTATAPKLATDLPRATEALSSPESTVRSATTPAVHDASTDTSPENAGPTYTEATEEKGGQPSDGDAQSDPLDAKSQHAEEPVVESAEDQLLQESNAASDQAEKTADVKPSDVQEGSAGAATQLKEGLQGKDARPSDIHIHRDADKLEIPDSREESPEQMDIDQSDVKKSTETGPQADSEKEPSTPTAPKHTSKDTSQPAQRAVTRVSSGAMRPKSVNEIVGKPGFDRPFAAKDLEDQLTPLTGASQSPGSRSRPMSSGRKQKGQVSSVVFGKQPKRLDEKTVTGTSKEPLHPSDDYFTPLFIQGFARGSQWMQPLEKILFHANKTVGTADANLAIQDHQACKVLHRVYHLQNHDKWTLRQPKRANEPTRPPSHWDMMLKEAKWMRTDFREERKWKTAVARNLAEACAAWCEASPEERKAMQVPAVIPPKPSATDDVTMGDDEEGENADNAPTPDLIPGDVESPQHAEELMEVFPETISPSAIFSLQEDDVVFGLRRTAASDKLLEELPMYGSPLKVWRTDPLAPDFDPDATWRRPAVPLSKYVEGQMRLIEEGPPRKKSRFDFDSDVEEEEVVFANDLAVHHTTMPPPTDEVALFRPEMKHIRDRLHAGHQFRPPTEHQMPSQNFYECRNASMWTQAEDDELRSLVREYSYNWPLISSMLTSKSLYSSGAERRTPWECFERWINLEGLPSDMQKTQYFRAYNSRIEAAQRVVMQNQAAAAQQANNAGGPPQPVRRRPTTPMRVERRRNQKHLALLDAMRKLAKKRETTIQKQQHTAAQNAANAANKKPNDAAAAQRPNKTPAEYSILRWERDQALAEKMAAFAQRQDAAKRAAIMQARAQGQGQGQGQGSQGMQAGQQANAANGAARPNQAAGANAARQQQQQRMPMQAPNGMAAAGQAQMAGQQGVNGQMNNGAMQQGQMQGMANQQRMAMPGHQQQPDASMMMRAQRISEQQRQAVQAQQHQQVQQQMQHPQQMQQQQQQQQQQGASGTPRPPSQHNSPPNMANGVNGAGMNNMNNMNGMNGGMNGTSGTAHQNFIHNQQAMMQSLNNANANGQASPPPMYMGAASPGSRPNLQVPPGFHNHIQQLEAQIRAKNPNMKPEHARQMAVDHMARAMLAQRQNAMTAAAGGAGAGQQHSGVANNIGATTSPHQYAALLRQQQQQQAAQQQQQQQQQAAAQAASSPGQASSHNRQSSEGATPGTAQ